MHCDRNSSFWLTKIFLLQNCQNCFLRLQVSTLIKKLFEKPFVVFFPDSEQSIFWLSAKILQTGCRNCFVRVQKTLWRCGIFLLFCFWCKFRFWANFFLTFGTNFSVKLSKLLSLCFDEHFDGKCFFLKFFFILFSDFERNNFWSRVEISKKASHNCILRVQKIFWGNRL